MNARFSKCLVSVLVIAALALGPVPGPGHRAPLGGVRPAGRGLGVLPWPMAPVAQAVGEEIRKILEHESFYF